MVITFFNISGGEIFIVLLVVFLFFGPDKIPEIARWIGKGIGEVKKATSEIRDELTRETEDIKKQANEIKKDLTIENPLKSRPTGVANKKDERGESDPEKKNREPHL